MNRGTSEPPKKINLYRKLADDLENLFIIYVWILDTRMLSRDQLLKLQYMVRSAPRTKKVMTLWRGLKEPNRFAHVGIVCPRDKPCIFNMSFTSSWANALTFTDSTKIPVCCVDNVTFPIGTRALILENTVKYFAERYNDLREYAHKMYGLVLPTRQEQDILQGIMSDAEVLVDGGELHCDGYQTFIVENQPYSVRHCTYGLPDVSEGIQGSYSPGAELGGATLRAYGPKKQNVDRRRPNRISNKRIEQSPANR